jgi:hypothetical protein
VTCLAASLAPLFAADDLPLHDLPGNLALSAAWHHYGDPRYGLDAYYEPDIRPVPYIGYYGFVHAFAYVLPVRWAQKLFMALSIAGLLFGVSELLRAHGRPRLLALGALPLYWSTVILWGWVNYVAGLAVLLNGCALLARMTDARPWSSARHAWGVAGTSALIYFLHPLALGIWILIVAFYLRPSAWFVVAVGVAVWVACLFFPGLSLKSDSANVIAVQWNGPLRNLHMFPDWLFGFADPVERGWLFIAYSAALTAAAFFTTQRPAARDRRPWRLLFICIGLYFVLPLHIDRPLGWAILNLRLAVLAAIVALACVPEGVLTGWRATVVAGPLALACLVYPLHLATKFAVFNGEMRQFYALVETLPYAPRVLTLVFGATSVEGAALRHVPNYVQLERGGYLPYAFGVGFPLRARLGVKLPPAPPFDDPGKFSWAAHGGSYEYFLTRAEPRHLFDGLPVKLVAQEGPWKLWRKRESP